MKILIMLYTNRKIMFQFIAIVLSFIGYILGQKFSVFIVNLKNKLYSNDYFKYGTYIIGTPEKTLYKKYKDQEGNIKQEKSSFINIKNGKVNDCMKIEYLSDNITSLDTVTIDENTRIIYYQYHNISIASKSELDKILFNEEWIIYIPLIISLASIIGTLIIYAMHKDKEYILESGLYISTILISPYIGYILN